MPHHSWRAVTQPAAGGIDTLGGGDPGGSQNFFGIILKSGVTRCVSVCKFGIMKLVRTNYHIPVEVKQWLRERKAKTGVPPAEQVRRILVAAMNRSRSSPAKK